MTDTAQVMSPGLDIGGRVAFWLRLHGYSAKRTARVLDASEATGKRLRSGTTPTTDQLSRLALHFGGAFVRHIYAAVLGPSDDELDRDLVDIKARLARLETANAPAHQARTPVLPVDGQDLGGLG